MSLTTKIAHNAIIQIAGKIVSVVLGLFAIGMMTRYLGQEQFGWYTTTIAFLQFIGILIDFGLIPVTAQMMNEPAFDKQQLFKNLLAFRFVTAVLFLGLAPFAALFFPYPIEVKIAIAFSTVSFLAVAMNQVLIGLYQTKLKMHIQAIGENIGRVVLVAGLWLLVTQNRGFMPVMMLLVFSNIAHTAYLWISANKESPAGFAFDWQIWKAIAAKMWPIAIAIMFNVVYLRGDTILLSVFRTQAEVGLYGAAYRVIDILSQTAMMLMGVLLPLLAYAWSRHLKEEFKKRFQQSFDTIIFFSVPMMIGTILLGDNIMLLVAGPDFAASGLVLKILSVAVFGIFLGAVFGHAAVAINKQKQTIWIYASDALLALVAYLIFIPRFGMAGAAWVSVFSELYAGILLFLVIRHYSREQLGMTKFAKILFASFVMAGAMYLLRDLHVIVLALAGALVYGAFAYALGVVSRETI